ncbi:TPA: hypothetical protein ACFITY_000245 [Neisseria gonorrhoeae]
MGEVAEYSKNRICSDKLNEHNYVGVDNLLQNREGKKLSGYVPSEGKMTEYIVNDILIGNIRPYLKKSGRQTARAEQTVMFWLSG